MSFFSDLGKGLSSFGSEVLKIGAEVGLQVGGAWLNQKINPQPKQRSQPASRSDSKQEQVRNNPQAVTATRGDSANAPSMMAGFGGKNMLIVGGLAAALLLFRKG